MIKQKINKNTKVLFSIIILIFLDILSKSYFTNKNYFKKFIISINYSQNYGSSFGIFSNFNHYTTLIIILSSIILFILIITYKNYFQKNKYLILTFIFSISGIVANTYDRIIFGFVRDFISIKYLFIFNLADLYLTIGATIYIIYELSENKSLKNKKNKKKYGRKKINNYW